MLVSRVITTYRVDELGVRHMYKRYYERAPPGTSENNLCGNLRDAVFVGARRMKVTDMDPADQPPSWVTKEVMEKTVTESGKSLRTVRHIGKLPREMQAIGTILRRRGSDRVIIGRKVIRKTREDGKRIKIITYRTKKIRARAEEPVDPETE